MVIDVGVVEFGVGCIVVVVVGKVEVEVGVGCVV